jgi:murein DD-endopeptidase MepM/ murein hydrolase activator NlpD
MKKSFLLAGAVILLAVAVIIIFQNIRTWQSRYSAEEAPVEDSTILQPPPSPKIFYGFNIDTLEVVDALIKRNENLSEILSRYNVSPAVIAEINSIPKDVFNVRNLRARKPYTIIHHKDSLNTALAFIYHPDIVEYVVMEFGDSLRVYRGRHKVDTLEENATGIIETSLYNAIKDAGGSPLLVNELADVYAWEIDFFGLQKGDAFKVIYEKYMVNGEDAGIGKIKAACFRHMDKQHYAILFDQGDGDEYFDLEGKSLRKTFLKAPLHYSRISSRFSYSRLHPILRIRRPHTGVDYAAPSGTPVVSVGDGTVIYAHYKGGGGNTVKIRHNSNYVTGYMHLSRYGKGIRKGVKVKQGQVIGYVGKTGLATGPHLDFRFWKNGKPVDPLKIDPPSANPIRKDVWEDYVKVRDFWKEKLDAVKIEAPVS